MEHCPGLASNKDVAFSNKDVAFSFLRVRGSNCARTQQKAHREPIWLKLDEIAGTLGRIYGAVVLLNVSNLE